MDRELTSAVIAECFTIDQIQNAKRNLETDLRTMRNPDTRTILAAMLNILDASLDGVQHFHVLHAALVKPRPKARAHRAEGAR